MYENTEHRAQLAQVCNFACY